MRAAGALAFAALLLVGCAGTATGTATAPTGSASAAPSASSPSAVPLPSPLPRSSRMAVSLGIASALPGVNALGSPWTLEGTDSFKSSVLSVAFCENVAEDETERIAGVSRVFVSGQGASEARAIAYVGQYLPGGAAKVLTALHTCVFTAGRPAVTVRTAADRVTRCNPERLLCYSVRIVGNTLAGGQANAELPQVQLVAAANRLADLVAARVPR